MDLTIIKFYRNQYSVNNRDVYLFEEILKRTDNQLEIEHDFIQWLFPDETGGVNSNAPHMTPELYEIFKTDKKIRYNVIRATIRMMNFYGYSFNFRNQTIHQIKELYRKENDHIVGLYSSHNYKRLTRMMRFLVLVDLPILSAMVFLCLCDAMKQDEKLLKQINNSGALNYWINTQTYLSEYTKKDILESLIGNLRNPDEVCFQGLEYVNNSCYQDVILLALFAKENPIIDNAIIYTDINALVKNKKNYANCGDDEKEDLENRTVIQEELKNTPDPELYAIIIDDAEKRYKQIYGEQHNPLGEGQEVLKYDLSDERYVKWIKYREYVRSTVELAEYTRMHTNIKTRLRNHFIDYWEEKELLFSKTMKPVEEKMAQYQEKLKRHNNKLIQVTGNDNRVAN